MMMLNSFAMIQLKQQGEQNPWFQRKHFSTHVASLGKILLLLSACTPFSTPFTTLSFVSSPRTFPVHSPTSRECYYTSALLSSARLHQCDGQTLRRPSKHPFLSFSSSSALRMGEPVSASTTTASNSVPKTGGIGATSAAEAASILGLSLGAPGGRPVGGTFQTKGRGNISITAVVEGLDFIAPNQKYKATSKTTETSKSSSVALEELVDRLDSERGVLLQSSYEFPGRYARWSLGFVNPPIEISGKGRICTIRALNSRGSVMISAIANAMDELITDGIAEGVERLGKGWDDDEIHCNDDEEREKVVITVMPPLPVGTFREEDRSRQPSLFSVVRSITDLFGYDKGDGQLGLYGAFGYDLTFQFEPVRLKQERDASQRDLLLYLPDEVLVIDGERRDAWRISYDFSIGESTTVGMQRGVGLVCPFDPHDKGGTDNNDTNNLASSKMKNKVEIEARDTPLGEFTTSVERAREEFRVGNLFETVLSQTFRRPLDAATPPSKIFRRLRQRNPSPYGFFINLGEAEYLVGASPEMFVRCEQVPQFINQGVVGGDTVSNRDDFVNIPISSAPIRVETCPISGTVARGVDALEDAQRVRGLLLDRKEESELTMCTDVDRNDKSRICIPGSVRVIGRRQIEMYSRLIHTVDHVEGYLRPEFDALDAFLCHTWAVTVTGAPKTWAIQFVEDNENSPRAWYGGAIGLVGFDGTLNTGLTLRTVRVKDGIAEVRAGATLLYDSNPESEEKETELKASAMLDAISRAGPEEGIENISDDCVEDSVESSTIIKKTKKVVLIDHEDSFVHTLGNYLRQTGADVTTLRSGQSALNSIKEMIEEGSRPDMVVLSPGPGNPSDFGLSKSISFLIENDIPAFGVCLGLQGMVEHFGGELGVLDYPMHGKPSSVVLTEAGKWGNGGIFSGIPDTFEVARYHSLHAEVIPECLVATARAEDGTIMALRHRTLPYAAVQFHPESILTSPIHGMKILENAMKYLKNGGEYEQFDGQDDNADNDDSFPEKENEILNKLGALSVLELKTMLKGRGQSCTGTKMDLMIKLALWFRWRQNLSEGSLILDELTVESLRDLKLGLRLKGTAKTRDNLLGALNECLKFDDDC